MGTLKVEEKYESIVSVALFCISLLVTGIGAALGAAIARAVKNISERFHNNSPIDTAV